MHRKELNKLALEAPNAHVSTMEFIKVLDNDLKELASKGKFQTRVHLEPFFELNHDVELGGDRLTIKWT